MSEQGAARRARPAWLLVGLVIGVILVPAAAVATTNAIALLGANGVRAVVSKAGQLTSIAADANNFHTFASTDLNYGTHFGCQKVFTAPSQASMIVTQLTIDATIDSSPGPGNFAIVSPNSNCATWYVDINPPTVGPSVLPLGPGIVVPAGHSLYAAAYSGVTIEVYGYGYFVPAATATVATPTISRSPALQGRTPGLRAR